MNFIVPSLVMSIIYMMYKIIDTKYISKEEKSLKNITKDSLVVFLCGIFSMFIIHSILKYVLIHIFSTQN